jgi:hypothetical protein
MFDILHLWSSKILTMVCDFIGHLVTIFVDVEMLHNNILGAIEEMQYKVDIKDEKNNIMHLRRLGLQIPMPLDDNTMVVHTWSNRLISKHKKSNTQFSQDQTPLSDL